MPKPSVDKPSTPLIVGGKLNHPTIGFFVPTLTIATHTSLWLGALDAAIEADANLIICPGQTPGAPKNSDELATGIFHEMVGKSCFDGIAAWTSAIGISIGSEAARHFFERYLPLPMVSIGLRMGDVPCIMLDNYSGIRSIIQHLVEVHGCRRLAFIHGQLDHIDDTERYQAYLEVLQEFQLPVDPDLVTPHGTWFRATGEQAIRILIDERQAQFDGVVAANDWLAVGAINELERRGIQVPRDVAVTGFADAPESRVGLPPVTTVSSRFYDRGRQSVQLLLAKMRGESIPVETRIPVQLIVRQSCGCQLASVMLAASQAGAPGVDLTSPEGRQTLIDLTAERLGNTDFGLARARQWIDTLAAVLAGQEPPAAFLYVVDRTLRQSVQAGFPLLHWQDAILRLRRGMVERLAPEQLRLTEDLWHQALAMITQAHSLTREAELMQSELHSQPLRELSQRLSTTFEMEALIDILADSLPRLGIPTCFLSLYENPQQSTEWARLVLAYTQNGRILVPAGGLRFPTQELVPPGLWSQGVQSSYIAEPLYFQQQPLGFALFEIGPRDGEVYDLLRFSISNALQGAILVQRGQKHAADLARQNYILDTFMENIPDLIYFKDLESRFTRINQACADWFGLISPAEALGKSDFDLMPKEGARQRYAQEQQIIATGQPLIRLEEADDRGYWFQTTKMPLRDENGQVVGTFGLSRDITEIKRVQIALERAYAEVEKQVEQRTAELRQEITERKQIESRLRQAVDRLNAITNALPDLVMVMDGEGRYHEVVETHPDLLYHPATGQILGKTVAEVLPADVAASFLVTIHQTIETGQMHSLEYELEVPAGQRWFEGRVSLLADDHDPHGKVVWLARDVTERKQADVEQKRLIAELEAKNAELEQFTYTVSHDLKAPLITISGFLGYIERDARSGSLEKLKTDLVRISDAAEKMQRLLNDVLELSRIGRITNPPAAVSFEVVLQGALELVAGRIEASGVKIEVRPNLPMVYVDQPRLAEVLQNLVDNACRFMGEQAHPRIEIGCQGLDSDGKHIFYVRDNGIGIDPRFHQKVFGLFNKLDPHTDGTGVGLALVKRIIEVHGGRIWLESPGIGLGATFYFTLPAPPV